MANVEKMSISLPSDLVEYIRDSVGNGSYSTASEFLRETLRERRRREIEERSYQEALKTHGLEKLRRLVQEGIDSGPSIPASEVFDQLEAKYAAMAKRKRAARK